MIGERPQPQPVDLAVPSEPSNITNPEPHTQESATPAPEQRDKRWMEYMEARHQSAKQGVQIEKILSEESPSQLGSARAHHDEYTRGKARRTLEYVLSKMSDDKYQAHHKDLEETIERYLLNRDRARIAEFQWQEQLSAEGTSNDPQSMGDKIFYIRLQRRPKGVVEASRKEAYFVLTFENDQDYLDFLGNPDLNASGGTFHRAMQLQHLDVDVVCIRGKQDHWRVLNHERQHFINDTIFNKFVGIDDSNVPPNKDYPVLTRNYRSRTDIIGDLQTVKDEMLARIREAGNALHCTSFFNKPLYAHLKEKFQPNELPEIDRLFDSINFELVHLFSNQLIDNAHLRALLVYHMVDVPLLRFPERLRALRDFYEAKFAPIIQTLPSFEDRYQKQRKPLMQAQNTDHAVLIRHAASSIGRILGNVALSPTEERLKIREARTMLIAERSTYDRLHPPPATQ